jgi:antirestriction protein ArdC
MSHSSGHKDRLNRKTLVENKGMLGDTEIYSKEELVAEVSSLYLSGIVGLEPKDSSKNSQAYLNGWIKFAEEDKKGAMVHAMTQASKSVNYILGE